MGIIEKQSVQDIANAIRNRNGLTTLYKPREMDEAILNLYSTTKVNSMLDYILPCYEKEATSYTIQYADSDRPGSITKLEGNTTQNGTPTPTNPSPIYTVSGDNEVVVSYEQHVTGNSYRVDFGDIELCKIGNYVDKLKRAEGKQLFDKDTTPLVVNTHYDASGVIQVWANYVGIREFMAVQPETTYTQSNSLNLNIARVVFYDKDKTFLSATTNTTPFTTPSNCYYIKFSIYSNNTVIPDNVMINYGSTALPYEPYGNNWYIEKNIEKVVLNGTEDITTNPNGTNSFYLPLTNTYKNANVSTIFSNYFKGISYSNRVLGGDNTIYTEINNNNATIRNTTFSSLENFKTWLQSNNVDIYYIKLNPTYETITNENLIQQLNNIQDMQLIENLCYVDWVGEEKPKMKLFCYLDKDKIIEEITG